MSCKASSQAYVSDLRIEEWKGGLDGETKILPALVEGVLAASPWRRIESCRMSKTFVARNRDVRSTMAGLASKEISL